MELWRTKSLEALRSEAEGKGPRLERALGPINLVMLGIGAIIGAGLFSITGIAAAQNAGPAVIISFILAAFGCTLAGLCLSELAAMLPISGGVYTYTYATMGELIAWLIGWLLIIEYSIGAATVSISWSSYVVSLLYSLHIELPVALLSSPWQGITLPDGTTAYGIVNLPALLIVFVLSMLLIFGGVKKSAFVNTLLSIVKMAVALIFIGVGFFYINYDNYDPFIPTNTGVFGEYGWSGIFRAAAVVFFAYIGFDAVSTAAQETKKPQRDLPIGIIGSLVISTLIYIVFSWVLVGLVPYQDLDDPAPIAVAIDQTPYLWLNWLVKLAIITGLSSVILVLLLGQSRVFYAMSRDGLLPRIFSSIHPKTHTPWFSSVVIMIFVSVCASFAPQWLVGQMTSLGALFIFTIVCAGVMVLRRTRPDIERPFKTPLVPFVPILGIVTCFLLMLSLGIGNWVRLGIWMAIGVIVYFAYGRRNSHLAKPVLQLEK